MTSQQIQLRRRTPVLRSSTFHSTPVRRIKPGGQTHQLNLHLRHNLLSKPAKPGSSSSVYQDHFKDAASKHRSRCQKFIENPSLPFSLVRPQCVKLPPKRIYTTFAWRPLSHGSINGKSPTLASAASCDPRYPRSCDLWKMDGKTDENGNLQAYQHQQHFLSNPRGADQTRADWDDLLQLPVRVRKTCNQKKKTAMSLNMPEYFCGLCQGGGPWLSPGTKISTPLLFSPALASSSPVAPVPAWSKDWKWSSDLQRFDKFEAIHWRALRLRRGRKLCTTSSPDICWDGTLARHFWTKGVLFDHVRPSGWVWKWCISVYPLK